MRTTLDLDDDVLASAKDIARRQRTTAGRVISDLARRALTGDTVAVRAKEPSVSYGFAPFATRGPIVTNDIVDRLREDGEY